MEILGNIHEIHLLVQTLTMKRLETRTTIVWREQRPNYRRRTVANEYQGQVSTINRCGQLLVCIRDARANDVRHAGRVSAGGEILV